MRVSKRSDNLLTPKQDRSKLDIDTLFHAVISTASQIKFFPIKLLSIQSPRIRNNSHGTSYVCIAKTLIRAMKSSLPKR